jgi:orotate phosphoribosyltransferase
MPRARVSKTSLADAFFEIGALRFGKFVLSSGKTSSYYLDLRVIPSHPNVYATVVEAVREVVQSLGAAKFDVLAGVATAGVTISSPLAFLLKKPMVYVRREEKGHGLDRLVEGAVIPGWKALVIDDVVTTGESIGFAVEALRREGCQVADAAVLVDRLEGAAANLRTRGVRLSAVVEVRELIDKLYEAGKVTKRDYEAVVRQVEGERR